MCSKTRTPRPAAPFSVQSKHVVSGDHVTWRRAGPGRSHVAGAALRGSAHAQPHPASARWSLSWRCRGSRRRGSSRSTVACAVILMDASECIPTWGSRENTRINVHGSRSALPPTLKPPSRNCKHERTLGQGFVNSTQLKATYISHPN